MGYGNDDLSADHAVMPGQAAVARDGDFEGGMAKAAAEAAFVRVMEFEANSKLMHQPEDLSGGVTRLDWDDIQVEGLVGVGGFACVCKVSSPLLELEDHSDEDDENKSSRSGTSNSSFGSGVFALKCLNQRTTMDKDLFLSGAADLASEFLLLSHLRHDNIVRIHGVSNGCVSKAFQESGGYFLLLELLRGTVADLLRLWREDLKDPAKASKIPPPLERLQGIATGVAKGMEYLHQNNIILRDLKPHNVGFDRDGNPRIFDLGLAREVYVDSTTTSTVIPGVAGSWRYMAPEVTLNKGSTFGSDVWSFGVLVWELMELVKPHQKIPSQQEYRIEVIEKGSRLSCRSFPTMELANMVEDCWAEDPQERPTFTSIGKTLETELANNKDKLAVNPTKMKNKQSWRDQFSNLKKSVQHQIRERRRSAN